MSMDNFFEQIVYSAANEDPESERRALRLEESDKVLCITGSGARPLDLLLDSPGEVVSIDFNPRQNHLLELKMAAIAEFDHQRCLEFLGVYPSTSRSKELHILNPRLSEAARAYWASQPEAIADGVIYCGVWEGYMRKVKGMMKPRHALLRRLITADTLEEQRELWKKWRTWYWVAGMKPMNWRWVWRTILKEPGIELIDKDYSISDHLLDTWDRAATTRLLKTNPYLNLMVGDGYTDDAMPLHLQKQHYETIKKNLPRVRILSESLLEHMRESPDTYSAFSVSDFSSYADPAMYKDVWTAIIHSAVDGAKVCERFFMVHYKPEELFPDVISRDSKLEKELFDQDHTFLYSFNCATLSKS